MALAQSCYQCAGCKEYLAQTSRILWGSGCGLFVTQALTPSHIHSNPDGVLPSLPPRAKKVAAGAAKILSFSRSAFWCARSAHPPLIRHLLCSRWRLCRLTDAAYPCGCFANATFPPRGRSTRQIITRLAYVRRPASLRLGLETAAFSSFGFASSLRSIRPAHYGSDA